MNVAKNTWRKWKYIIKMWDDILDERRSRYDSERGISLRKPAYVDSNFQYSQTNQVTAYYYIDQLPEEMEIGYRATLRSVAPIGVGINFIELNENFEINWNDPAFKSRMTIRDTVAKDKEQEYQNESEYTAHKNKHDRDVEERLVKSIQYVRTATMNKVDVRKLLKVRILVIITGNRGADFSSTLESFERLCNSRDGLKYHRIHNVITDTVKDLSPFRLKLSEAQARKYPSTLSSDELRARFHPFEQGIVGYGRTYIGTNIHTNSPVFVEFKRNPTDAEIILALGMTGSGKSFLIKDIVVQLPAHSNMVMTINDYEGGEYDMLGDLVAQDGTTVKLDFSKGSGRYYDPTPLVSTGVPSLDEALIQNATENIIALFRAIGGKTLLENHDWIPKIIENGTNQFYRDLGVTEDTSTWIYTAGKSIYDVYQAMLDYRPLDESDLEKFQQDRAHFIEKYAPYLDKTRKINNYFKHAVSLHDIVDADVVICNYNMRGVSESQLSELDQILIPLNASIISYYRTIFPFARGKYNIKVWEEVQRMNKLEGAISLLKTPLSGGRKMGDINIVSTNDPAELLKEDVFNLFDSATLRLVGKIPSAQTRELVCQRLGLQDVSDELDLIGEVVDEEEGINVDYDDVLNDPYKKAFVAKLATNETVVIKAMLPKNLAETPLFKTGVAEQQIENTEYETEWGMF